MIPLGHASTHCPHPVHSSSTTVGKPFSFINIAPNWQALTQSLPPRHPYKHILSPPATIV